MILIILTTFLLSLNFSTIIWLLFRNKNLRRQLTEYKRRLNLVDNDIRTLHFNQKVLSSLVKEIRRDLLVYGEIKKSKNKAASFEKQEEN